MRRLLVLAFFLMSCGSPSQQVATKVSPSPSVPPVPACVEIAAKTLASQGKTVIHGFFDCNAPGELRDSLIKDGVIDDVTMAKWMGTDFPWTGYTVCGSTDNYWYIDLDDGSNHLSVRFTLDTTGQITELGARAKELTNTCSSDPITKK